MLLINIHQLDIILADPITARALKRQVDAIRRVLRLQRQNIVVLRRPQDFGQGVQVDAERDVAVAAVGREL